MQIAKREKEMRGLSGEGRGWARWTRELDTGVGGELCCLGWICGGATGVAGRDWVVRWELGARRLGIALVLEEFKLRGDMQCGVKLKLKLMTNLNDGIGRVPEPQLMSLEVLA